MLQLKLSRAGVNSGLIVQISDLSIILVAKCRIPLQYHSRSFHRIDETHLYVVRSLSD